ncbi:MAG TPA: YbjN domain-containing protein [Phycisphaerae bacterium]|nr:YbjN domain-containing protein [Phycisphaerae bacterium]
MPTTMKEIKQLVRELELNYWVSGQGDFIMIPFQSDKNHIEVVITLHNEGTFLQFCSRLLPFFGADSTDNERALQMVNAINMELRFIKWFHNQEDQSLRAYGDFWILDGQLTALQFRTMLYSFKNGLFHMQAKLVGIDNNDTLDVKQIAED